MSVRSLIEDKDSEIVLMSILSLDTEYVREGELKQVRDAIINGWYSIKDHKEQIDSYWKQISDKDAADYYVKNFYSNVLGDFYEDVSEGVTKYICFFLTPRYSEVDYPSDDRNDYCLECNNGTYIRCPDCDELSLFCDTCDDVGFVECSYCCKGGGDAVADFLVGAVSWYSFKNPYTEESNNAMYIDSFLYFGCYEFLDNYESSSMAITSTLNHNEVSDDVNSALIWTQISQIEEIDELVNSADYNTSYYGLINSYSDLLKRIEATSGIKISQSFQSYRDSNVKL